MVETIWLAFLFLISVHAYLSFSFVAQDAVDSLSRSLEFRAEQYEIKPLSTLYSNPERLVAILSFSRLLCAIPVLLLTYKWASSIGGWSLTAGLACVVVLLYLLPEWLLPRAPRSIYRGTVQVFGILFYLLFWPLAKVAPAPAREGEPKAEENTGNQEAAEETKEFKVDILKAISMIGETTVREVMTPRVDMVCLPTTATLDELHHIFKDNKFSRVPIYKEKIDNIAGIVSVMDLVGHLPQTDLSSSVAGIMRPAVFVPETKKVFTLLLEFREARTQVAVVIDEYGGTSGLVTMEDLLEEIVGEIQDEYDEAPYETHREKEGTYVVSGKFPVERIEEIFGVQVPAEDFETISGLIFSILGRIPIVGEVVRYKNLNMEVLEADKRRIHRIRIRALPQEDATTEA